LTACFSIAHLCLPKSWPSSTITVSKPQPFQSAPDSAASQKIHGCGPALAPERVEEPRQELLHVRKLPRAQDEPLEVALRRLALEICVREDRGHSDDGRDELALFVFPQ
jgi:hypothetical protein